MTNSITRRRIHALKRKLKREGNEQALYELKSLLSVHSGRRRHVSASMREALTRLLEEKSYRAGAGEIISELTQRYGAIWEEEDTRALIDTLLSVSLGHIAEEGSGDSVSAARAMLNSFSAVSPYLVSESLSGMHALLSDRSPEYRVSDSKTKRAYRTALLRVAKKEGIGSTEAAQKYLDRLSELPGVILGSAPRLYFVIYTALTLLPSACLFPLLLRFGVGGGGALPVFLPRGGTAYCIAVIACSLLLLLPSAESARILTDRFFLGKLGYSELPRVDIRSIPENGKTLVCITSLLFGGKRDGELFDRLERYYLGNRGENIRFAVLGDLPDSETASADGDEETLSYAEESITRLRERYGDSFFLFVRERKPSGDGIWRGWERKRGAVLELIRFCRGDAADFGTVIADQTFLAEAKYLITLDADTVLNLGAAGVLVSAMLHPSAQPVIKDGRVVSGHGIIQPRMVTTAESAAATPFAVMSSGGGGSDTYSRAGYDTYQSLFDEGNFCGKGIIDIEAYYELLCDRFPEETVLSHDLLEGIILRSAIDGECHLSDSTPKNPVSFMTRAHRWIRGDVQAWLYGMHEHLDALSRFKLFDNVRHALTPLAALTAIVISAFIGGFAPEIVVPSALLYTAIPLIVTALSRLRDIPSVLALGGAVSVRSGRIRGAVMLEAQRMLYSVCTVAYQAARAGDAAIRAAVRTLFTHRRMLEWTTAAEGDRYSGHLTDYTIRMMPSVLLGVAFMLTHSTALRLLGMLMFIAPTLAWRLGTPYKKRKKSLDGDERAELLGYASDIWQFFADTVTREENHLPPDNVSYLSEVRIADRTSPTNIGLYLMSAVAARDLGLIETTELLRRLRDTTASLMKLELWHGHLYNWYSVSELSVLSPYVSAVDSGNFVASLMAVCSALSEYEQECPELAQIGEQLGRLWRGADFSVFYSEDRGLMHTGINTSSGEYDRGYYDIYMSESRTTYYIAVAMGQLPPSAWRNLGRVFASYRGEVGMLSWGGTAFEYFMPTLFYMPPADTAEYETLRFGARGQIGGAFRGVWGKSEGCYCAYDRDGNYRYKAIGVSSLALGPGGGERVYSPYSSFLVMQCGKKRALENLRRFREFGMYGRYGYYEALDLTPSRVGDGYAVVRCYMSHHMGMSLAAIDNVCEDGIFRRRLSRMPELACAAGLTDERIPIGSLAPYVYNIKSSVRRAPRPLRTPLPQVSEESGRALLVSDGAMHICLCSDGAVQIRYGRLHVSAPVAKREDVALVAVKSDGSAADGEDLSDVESGSADSTAAMGDGSCAAFFGSAEKPASAMRLFVKSSDGEAHALKGRIRCDGESTELKSEDGCTLRLIPDGEDNTVTVLGHFSDAGGGEVMLYLEPRLTSEEEWDSHPAYAGLAFDSSFDSRRRLIMMSKKNKNGGRLYLCAAFLEGELSDFTTVRRGLLPERYTEDDVAALLDRELDCRTGICVSPVLVMKGECRGRFGIVLSVAAGKEQAIRAIEEKRRLLVAVGGRIPPMKERGQDIGERLMGELVTAAVFGKERRPCMPARSYSVNELWKHGISGDCKIAVFFLCGGEEESGRGIRELMRCAVKLYLHSFPLDIVFAYDGGGEYYDRQRDMLLRAAENAGADFLIGAKPGIHPVALSTDGDRDRELLSLYSSFTLEVSASDTAAGIVERLARVRAQPQAARDTAVCRTDSTVGKWRFDSDCAFTVRGKASPLPWSYLLGGLCFGTLVTDRSFGFTWLSNSREVRITPWSGDEVGGLYGEDIVTEIGGVRYSLSLSASETEFNGTRAVYRGSLPGHDYTVEIGCEPKLPVKLFRTEGIENTELRLALCAREGAVIHSSSSDADFFTVLAGQLAGRTVFVLRPEPGVYAMSVFSTPQDFSDVSRLISHPLACYLRERYSIEGRAAEIIHRRDICDGICLRGAQGELDSLFTGFLLHQTYHSRMRGRTGFFQPGGAYGFRDQLQDAGALVYADPYLVRCHLIRCASRQYREGDVMHWWHDVPTPHGSSIIRGVRTRCSDDRFWLPLILCEYISLTGDESILSFPVPYLCSPVLSEREGDRYEEAVFSPECESMYLHCMRALRSVSLGLYGLPLIGSCDWNDGLSGIGSTGGVSVWLGFFLRVVIGRFLPMCEKMGEYGDIEYLTQLYKKLEDATLSPLHRRGGYYIRAYYGDGTPLGCECGDEPVLDSISQSWAYFAASERKNIREYVGDRRSDEEEFAAASVYRAYERLFDPASGTTALLSSPLRRTETYDPGYICRYPDGMRENGGQYTHAAIWLARALIRSGAGREGLEVAHALDPSAHKTERYLGEPYSVPGDVCTGGELCGTVGWTQYTGAAGWYYRLILEDIIGYREESDGFFLSPCRALDNTLTVTVARRSTSYRITLSPGDGISRLDGKELQPNVSARAEGNTASSDKAVTGIKFPLDGEEHNLVVYLGT